MPPETGASLRAAWAPAVAMTLAGAAGVAWADAPPASAETLAAIDACIEDYRRAEDAARESPEPGGAPKQPTFLERCPEAHAGIAGSVLAPQLTPDWDERVSSGKLRRLRSLLEPAPRSLASRPDTGRVAQIVRDAAAATEVRKRSLWQRFKDWLRAWLKRAPADDGSGWLARWLDEHVPVQRVVVAILYVLLAVIVAGIAWFTWIELRAAGVLGRGWRRRNRATPSAEADPGDRAPTLAGASDEEAPSVLIELVLGELRRLGRVHDRSGMTHRELARAAHFDVSEEGEAFRGLLGTAERLRYDQAPLPAGRLRAAIDGGRRLLESLVRQPRGAT